MKPIYLVTGIFLVLVSSLHLLRLIFHIAVTIGGYEIPFWLSLFGMFFPAALALLLWREAKGARP
jgi:hypothetical protein